MFIYCTCTQYLVGAPFALITASIRHGGDQFLALLRWYGSPGFFDSSLQLICIFFGLLFLIFLLTIPHRFSMGFRSGEFAGQSNTPTHGHLTNFWCFWQCGQVPNPAGKLNQDL